MGFLTVLTRVLGVTLLFAGAGTLVCVAAMGVLAKWQTLIDRHDQRIEELERRRMAQHMLTASWWFSEDSVTMKLVEDLGRSYNRGGYPIQDIEQIRERWRALRRNNDCVEARIALGDRPPIRIPADNKGDCHESRSKSF